MSAAGKLRTEASLAMLLVSDPRMFSLGCRYATTRISLRLLLYFDILLVDASIWDH